MKDFLERRDIPTTDNLELMVQLSDYKNMQDLFFIYKFIYEISINDQTNISLIELGKLLKYSRQTLTKYLYILEKEELIIKEYGKITIKKSYNTVDNNLMVGL